MAKLTLKSSAVEALQRHSIAVVPYGFCSHVQPLVDLSTVEQDATFQDLLDITPENSIPLGIEIMGPISEPEVVTYLISKISEPAQAFRVYLRYKHLTTEQDALLKAKFDKKLPTAEKSLADGVLVRTKLTTE